MILFRIYQGWHDDDERTMTDYGAEVEISVQCGSVPSSNCSAGEPTAARRCCPR